MAAARIKIIVVDYVGENVGQVLATVVSSFILDGPPAPERVTDRRAERARREPPKIATPATEGEPVTTLGVGKRIQNCLAAGPHGHGSGGGGPITTTEQLIGLTEGQVMKCPNMGPVGIKKIKAALAKRGLSLKT